MGYVIAAALVIALGIYCWWELGPRWSQERRFKKAIATREPISDAEMASRYFSSEGAAVQTPKLVRQLFAKHTSYPVDKLLRDDDLTFYWDGLDMIDLVRDVESTFGITISDANAEGARCTIRSVTMLVARNTMHH